MKSISLILFTLITLTTHAQEAVSLSIHQDSRLAFTGDDHGNPAGTINLMVRLKMQGCQFKHGYLVIFPEFEYGDLETAYKRYSANIGYTFNQTGILGNRLELSGFGGFGWIVRSNATAHSFGGSFEAAYRISYRTKLSFVGQLTHRRDLEMLWGDDAYRYSAFFGIEVNLN